MRLSDIENPNTELLKQHKTAVKFSVNRYRKNHIAIYRGIRDNSPNIKYINPMYNSTNRISANSQNYYTLWIDNNEKWKDFPKRSKSLICSSSISVAEDFGKAHVVIPLINCRIGVCPKDDLWFSFEKTSNVTIDTINNVIFEIAKEQNIVELTSNRGRIDNYHDLIVGLNKINVDDLVIGNSYYYSLNTYFKEFGVVGFFDKVLDPHSNNFKITDWKNFDVVGKKEIWFSAPSLLLTYKMFIEIVNDEYGGFSI